MKQKKGNIYINKVKTNKRVTDWRKIKQWLEFVAKTEKHRIEFLSYSLVTDDSLLKMNNKVLMHNYYTDILTFNLGESKENIVGDIYISIDRVVENSRMFHVKQMDELRRVFLHGLLHLIGYDDKTKKEKQGMRSKEDYYLKKYELLFSLNKK